MHVRMPIPAHAAHAVGRAKLNKYYDEETAKAVATARKLLAKAGLEFTELHRLGDPGAEIAGHAVKGKFDMIVMGSHGHGMLSSLILGSVASKVLARCKVPVLIVR